MPVTKKSVPVASPVVQAPPKDITEETLDITEEEHEFTIETIKNAIKDLDIQDILALIKTASIEAEKKAKSAGLKVSSTKKKGSAPKGVSPPQLAKPRAWVEFVLQYALQNGWESFVCKTKKKDKTTEQVEIEEIEMPGSVMHDECWVYEGSVTEKNPNGKQLIHKEAMSLSKVWWSPKEKTGTHPEIYDAFEEQYVPPEPLDSTSSESSSASSSVVRKLTAAEKEAEKEAKKEAKEKEKAEKKEAKEKEKAEKKAAKEAEKAEKKAEKEKDKTPKKVAEKKPTGPIKASAVATTLAAKKATTETTPKPMPKKIVKKEEWTCPNDGNVYPWDFMGKKYFRNHDGEVWESDNGELGSWAGKYDNATGKIDDSVPEPEYE
jgi:hypothetical protein